MSHHSLTHGHTVRGERSPTYTSWAAMRERCTRPGYHNYHLYGGAGIRVCARWNDFSNFLADMGERPEGMTLDRIDSTKGYEPSNCRWATSTTQNRNSANTKLTAEKVREIRRRASNGERVGKLAAEFDVNHSLISVVISRRTWKDVE
jgi:hypothetical protein